jgi:hypothetical protein
MTKAAELAKMGEVLTNSQIGGRRNVVINGAMQVAQRGTSSTGLGATSGYYTLDRNRLTFSGTAGRLTMTQTADGPSGFANCLKLDCTTADTSIAAGEILILGQNFEGQDLQQFKKGTSDAEKITVSFYVKGNANATYTCELYDNDNSRSIAQEFSVTASWTRVVLTFNNETSNALDNDNASSLSLHLWLHGGSTFAGGTFASNTWHTTNANRLSDSQSSFFDSTDRTFFITGIQMEVGSQATPFEHRSFGEELAFCQRYCHRINSNGSDDIQLGTGFYNTTTTCRIMVTVPTIMRAIPAFTTLDSGLDILRDSSSDTSVTLSAAIDQSAYGCGLNINDCTSTTVGEGVILRLGSEAANFIEFDAEL